MTPVGLDFTAAARSNDAFRRVIDTGEHAQVVVMSIAVGDDIGEEVHPDTDQIFLIVAGRAEARVEGTPRQVGLDDLLFVHAGTRHNIINIGEEPLRVITIYTPPQHAPATVHQTKADAIRAEHG
jgi:mannose-6-phosphate isomerase-like protein (cupin superfamily)